MDVLILNWKDIKNPHVGGAEVIAFEFARRLIQEGNTVTYFCRTFPNCLAEEIIDGIKIVRRGGTYTVFIHAYFYYKNLQQKPNKVIEMINTIGWQTPLYVPQEKRIAYLNQLAREVWFYEFPFPLSSLGFIFEQFQYISYSSTKFLCYSNSTKKDLISVGIKQKNISVFPLGLDHKRYQPGKKSKIPLFVFVARLVRMKRADICIEATKTVLKKYPGTKLAIIGNGPDEDRLKRLVQKNSLEENVIFVDKNNFHIQKKSSDVKVAYMQQAWALVLPSVKEGWGMVVTEAAACGTPSIVSNVSGLRDSVIPERTGVILSKIPSEAEIEKAMRLLIEDNTFRKKISKEAITWSKKFNWEKSYTIFKKYVI